MPELSPRVAAELAKDIYLVQQERMLKAFLLRPEFSTKSEDAKHLKAEVGSRLVNTRDGFGVCALGGDKNKNELFVVFRGSTSANHNADWVSNARIGIEFSKNGMPVHIGFNSIFSSMLPQIRDFIKASKNIQTIHCIGHSLGGAVATLTADWLVSNSQANVKLYTFGAPKPGLFLFASNLTRKLGKKNVFRTYHATDPVPMIPLFPFVHPPLPGFGHYIPSSENILSADAHDIGKYLKSVKTSSWAMLERRSPPYSMESAVENWLKSKAPVNASSPKIWQWINEALIYVIKKIVGAAAHILQTGFMGVMTLADTLAWILRKGLDIAKSIGQWVLFLMRKIMQVLGRKPVEKKEELSQSLMRTTMNQLMVKTSEEAKRAIQNIK